VQISVPNHFSPLKLHFWSTVPVSIVFALNTMLNVVRAQSVFTYFRLLCFLTVIYFSYLSFFKIRSLFSENCWPIATKFCMVIVSCYSFDPLTSDFPYPCLNILSAKNWSKFGFFLPPSPCAPTVLSADRFQQTEFCQFRMFSLPVWHKFQQLSCKLFAMWCLVIVTIATYAVHRFAKQCHLLKEFERTALWTLQ